MEDIGWASLQVIPSIKGFEGKLSSQTGPALDRAGTKGGLLFGNSAGKSMSKGFLTHAKAAALGAGALLGGAAAIGIKFGKDSLQGYEDHLRVVGITKSAIKATGGAANITAKQVGHLTDKLEAQTGVDGDLIQQGANMLLTFKNVRNETGKNNDIYNQSVSILTDMSTAMGTDAKSSAIQLGKALNDPVKGITALSRVGVTFDAQQKKQIQNFVDQGKSADAQKIILKELSSEFGGAAKAQETMGDRVLVSYHALQDEVGKALLPQVQKFEGFLSKKGIPAAEQLFRTFEKKGIPKIKEFVTEVKPLANSILPAAATGFSDVAGFLKDAAPYAKKTIDAFNSLPDWAQKSIVLGTAGGLLAKKTGALSLGKNVLGSGLKIATKADPLPVYVVNNVPGLGGPGGSTPSPVPVGSPKIPGLVSGAVAAQIAKGIYDDVSILRRQRATPTPTDPSALAASQLGAVQGFKTKSGSKIDIDFARLSQSLDRYGSHSLYAQQLTKLLKSHDLVVNPNQAGAVQNAVRDLSEAEKIADRLIKGNVLSKIPAALERGVSGLTQPLARASTGLDLISRQGNHTFGGLASNTDAFGHKIDSATTRTDILEGRLRRFPRRIRTELDLDTTAAERNLATLRAHAGRHIPAALSIELAGRPTPQRALDGVRR